MNIKLKLIGVLILSAIATLFLYIILHEAGHCVVAIACGAKITGFSIFDANMSYKGGNFSDLQMLWLHVNGMLFPLIISYVFSIFYRKEQTNRIYRILSYFTSIIPMFSSLAWVFVPILFLNGNAPNGDDCTKFVDIFSSRLNYSPLLVSAGAILLIALSLILIIRKKILKNFIDLIKATR